MSIYPVKLIEWFPPNDEMYSRSRSAVECVRCLACGSKVNYKKAYDYDSIPWGHGDIWCSKRCLNSKKIARPDKRRERRMRRKYKDCKFFITVKDTV